MHKQHLNNTTYSGKFSIQIAQVASSKQTVRLSGGLIRERIQQQIFQSFTYIHSKQFSKGYQVCCGGDSDSEMFSISQIDEYARLDTNRAQRCGLPEVVWGPGKDAAQVMNILVRLAEKQQISVASRIDYDKARQIQQLWQSSTGEYSEAGLLHQMEVKSPKTVSIVTGGTSDQAVAEECAVILRAMGYNNQLFQDCGVAAIQRLLKIVPDLEKQDVAAVVVVAGMDAALPSVVAGLVSSVVIAVPTSVGYGAALQGIGPLISCLNACAPGVVVCNVDNGFGAAMSAAKIINRLNPQQS